MLYFDVVFRTGVDKLASDEESIVVVSKYVTDVTVDARELGVVVGNADDVDGNTDWSWLDTVGNDVI